MTDSSEEVRRNCFLSAVIAGLCLRLNFRLAESNLQIELYLITPIQITHL